MTFCCILILQVVPLVPVIPPPLPVGVAALAGQREQEAQI